MRKTLPTLPRCGQQATRRIEVYSPANGTTYGSLDAVAYTCSDHTEPVRRLLDSAGLTGWIDPTPVDADQRCVYLFRFDANQPVAGGR